MKRKPLTFRTEVVARKRRTHWGTELGLRVSSSSSSSVTNYSEVYRLFILLDMQEDPGNLEPNQLAKNLGSTAWGFLAQKDLHGPIHTIHVYCLNPYCFR